MSESRGLPAYGVDAPDSKSSMFAVLFTLNQVRNKLVLIGHDE
jgi:hypothetical protein